MEIERKMPAVEREELGREVRWNDKRRTKALRILSLICCLRRNTRAGVAGSCTCDKLKQTAGEFTEVLKRKYVGLARV